MKEGLVYMTQEDAQRLQIKLEELMDQHETLEEYLWLRKLALKVSAVSLMPLDERLGEPQM